MEEAILKREIAALLAGAGIDAAGMQVEPCASGGNNRVLRVSAGGRRVVAKQYFRQGSDDRDRLGTEYAFLECVSKAGIDCVPAPLNRDDRSGIALYEFVEGRKPRPGEVGDAQVAQALGFFRRLNDSNTRRLAAALPDASEARFGIAEQLQLVEDRVDRLAAIPVSSCVDEQAMALGSDLRERWVDIRERVRGQCAGLGLDLQATLTADERCLSASDFGFHNAIEMPTGKIVFIDFEYAGWDDPAKALCDFFSQPSVPVPLDYFDGFLASALSYSPDADRLARRARLLLPVFRMKWCCIMMNDFLPGAFQRRRFADPAIDATTRKQIQLDKARGALETIT